MLFLKVKFMTKIRLKNSVSKLDLYIQPSLTEGHCRAIVEAIGNGVPTLASNAGGNTDSVDENYLFKPKDVVKLTELIKRTILSKDIEKKTF